MKYALRVGIAAVPMALGVFALCRGYDWFAGLCIAIAALVIYEGFDL